ncbi:aryl-alcohol dehydrogenase-like predicted oxidoreductase [Sphingomonas vulcanisoli]|uniref:Aryl-alcohol dehydrogenase-like predicted oxidoreductase n=1 Tax=Sphingomonas vulcanisoli TaxID=1658060 RepID=A0ABX0TQT3_9SPHN|nr:aldo/keto reductase [Sphingomonas vulcanisoli]NIJ06747.1 aryl-alcohol dehydrogenase-like predicted oxidoreductase [Sphingomonas vulcanisoli]
MPRIGKFEVGQQGLGGMSLSGMYGRSDDSESLATLQHALDLGITFFDTATAYGSGHNEHLFGSALRAKRDEIVVASKFLHNYEGCKIDAREAVEASLKRLGFDHIDIYYLHRVDAEIPVEESIGQLGRLVDEGKIGGVGISEASADQLRRGHATYPVTALQSEYSLWSRDIEFEILPTARELGIGFVGFSPLGRGFLAGALPTDADDRRNIHPRYREEAIAENAKRRRLIEDVAERLHATPAQVCIAWVQAKGVVPIPGTRHIRHLEDNWAANAITLDDQTIADLDSAFPHGTTAGDRFPPEQMKQVPVPPASVLADA